MLYMDNGPIARSQVFQRVMELLGVQIRTHLPKGKDGRRTTARSKGKVGSDALISVDGGNYRVDPELAGRDVILWWGLFDTELFVELEGKRYGPFHPAGAPIPLHRFRRYKKTRAEKRADTIEKLAREISLSKDALSVDTRVSEAFKRDVPGNTRFVEFQDPDPFNEFTFPNIIEAKKAIADYLGIPLSKLGPEQLEKINSILSDTLRKKDVMDKIRSYFREQRQGGLHVK
jgi:hypothetical protein